MIDENSLSANTCLTGKALGRNYMSKKDAEDDWKVYQESWDTGDLTTKELKNEYLYDYVLDYYYKSTAFLC
jgi:hypothetical protein